MEILYINNNITGRSSSIACLHHSHPSLLTSLLEDSGYLQTTFPRLPCLLASGWVLPMGENDRRLEGGRKGEDIFLQLLVVAVAPEMAFCLSRTCGDRQWLVDAGK